MITPMNEEKKTIPGNYYGTPEVREEDGKFYFCLDNYDGVNECEVSKEFYEAFMNEFKR